MTHNKSLRLHSFLCGALGIVLPTLFIFSFILNTFSKEQLDELFGEGPARTVSIFTVSPECRAGNICTNNISVTYDFIPYFALSHFSWFSECLYNVCLTGNSDVFMGVDTRRWASCVCDHFWSFLLPPTVPSKVFCRVSVTNIQKDTELKNCLIN